MPRVLLLTTDELPSYDADTPLLMAALADRGLESIPVGWRRSPEKTADLAVIRSTWDYASHRDTFLDSLSRLRAPLLNPLEVVRWDSHKGYLVELADAGVPVVPTSLVPAGSRVDQPGLTGELVVKPAVGASAVGTRRFSPGDPAAGEHLGALLTDGDALVQPLIDLSEGERSLLYLGGAYSHTIRKTPADGDFRVQAEYGGSEQLDEPTAAELAVAGRALAAAPGTDELLYARVDLVGDRDAPMVMELELIEPQLFLDHAVGAADLLADAVLRAVSRCGGVRDGAPAA